MCRSAIAEIAAVDEHSAGFLAAGMRELAGRFGVYRDVFEQSILRYHDAHRSRNFVASLSAELLIVSLALLIPLAYSDHLPVFHWQSVAMRPAPAPLLQQVVVTRRQAATSRSLVAPTASAPRPIFHFEPTANASYAQTPTAFPADAPPMIGVNSVGDSINQVEKFLANMPAPPPPKLQAPHANTPSGPLRVGGAVQMAKLIRKVTPEYPPLAKAARISGVVYLIGTIGKDGAIRNLRLAGGHPMLARAAMEAVEQWVYEPTLLNGEPVEVIAPIEVSFTLGR
jgi:periplasmic protein TonB